MNIFKRTKGLEETQYVPLPDTYVPPQLGEIYTDVTDDDVKQAIKGYIVYLANQYQRFVPKGIDALCTAKAIERLYRLIYPRSIK